MLPSDATLTEDGLPLARPRGRVLLIACGALAREILDLKRLNGWDHLDLTCLPAKYHLYPEKITEEVRKAVAQHRTTHEDIFVVYADCGTGGLLQAACDALGVEMIAGPHCYSFIEGNDRFVGDCTTIKAFHRPGPAHADFEDYDVLPTLTEKAVAYITEHAEKPEPFFLYMPLNSPHTPISPSKSWQGKSEQGPYGDFVMETDDSIGHVGDDGVVSDHSGRRSEFTVDSFDRFQHNNSRRCVECSCGFIA